MSPTKVEYEKISIENERTPNNYTLYEINDIKEEWKVNSDWKTFITMLLEAIYT